MVLILKKKYIVILLVIVVVVFFSKQYISAINSKNHFIKNDLFQLLVPKDWYIDYLDSNGYEMNFTKNGKVLGWLHILTYYPWDENLDFALGIHKEIIEQKALKGLSLEAYWVRLERDVQKNFTSNSTKQETHICFIDKRNNDIYDFSFNSEYINEKTIINIAKSFNSTFNERLYELTQNPKPVSFQKDWINKIEPLNGEENLSPNQSISITFKQDMDASTIIPLNIFIFDENELIDSQFFRSYYDNATCTYYLPVNNYSYRLGTTVTVYITSNVRNLQGDKMGQTYYFKLK